MCADVLEKKDKYVVKADLPGLCAKNVKVEVDSDGILHITTTRESRHEDEDESAGGTAKWHAYERVFGRLERMIKLPEDVDQESIETLPMKYGELTIELKKKPKEEAEEAEAPRKEIPVYDH